MDYHKNMLSEKIFIDNISKDRKKDRKIKLLVLLEQF